jgi:hypothetical protein
MAIEILDLKAPPVRVIEVCVFGLAFQLHACHRLHTRELINNPIAMKISLFPAAMFHPVLLRSRYVVSPERIS